MVLEKTLESSLDSKEIKPVSPKGNQPGIFIGRTDAEAPILWPPDAKNQLIGKDPDAGKDWGQDKGATEDELTISDSMDMSLSKLKETVKDREAWVHFSLTGEGYGQSVYFSLEFHRTEGESKGEIRENTEGISGA